MVNILIYAREEERGSLASKFETGQNRVWIWFEDEEGRGTLHDAGDQRQVTCVDLRQAQIDLLMVHHTVWKERPIPCLPPPNMQGPMVFYSSEEPRAETDLSRRIYWLSHRVQFNEGNPVTRDEAKSLVEWATSGDLSNLPVALQPRRRRESLLKLLVLCQGYLAVWFAGNPNDHRFVAVAERLGWSSLQTSGLSVVPRNATLPIDTDFLARLSAPDCAGSPMMSRWWQELLGQWTWPCERGALPDTVLLQLQGKPHEMTVLLLQSVAGEDTYIAPDIVAGAYTELADAVEQA